MPSSTMKGIARRLNPIVIGANTVPAIVAVVALLARLSFLNRLPHHLHFKVSVFLTFFRVSVFLAFNPSLIAVDLTHSGQSYDAQYDNTEQIADSGNVKNMK